LAETPAKGKSEWLTGLIEAKAYGLIRDLALIALSPPPIAAAFYWLPSEFQPWGTYAAALPAAITVVKLCAEQIVRTVLSIVSLARGHEPV
jgi:hypothetical protein